MRGPNTGGAERNPQSGITGARKGLHAMVERDRETLQDQRLRYLRRAEEAVGQAAAAQSADLRNAYLKLSEAWLALVREIDTRTDRR
jgi:hypothetical protein